MFIKYQSINQSVIRCNMGPWTSLFRRLTDINEYGVGNVKIMDGKLATKYSWIYGYYYSVTLLKLLQSDNRFCDGCCSFAFLWKV